MQDTQHYSKIKNERIVRWRLELSFFTYDIVYRPGDYNKGANAFSRICGCNNRHEIIRTVSISM